MRQAVAELEDIVLLREHELDRSEIKRFGTGMNLILINGIDVSYIGPPPTKEWVLDAIRKNVDNLEGMSLTLGSSSPVLSVRGGNLLPSSRGKRR